MSILLSHGFVSMLPIMAKYFPSTKSRSNWTALFLPPFNGILFVSFHPVIIYTSFFCFCLPSPPPPSPQSVWYYSLGLYWFVVTIQSSYFCVFASVLFSSPSGMPWARIHVLLTLFVRRQVRLIYLPGLTEFMPKMFEHKWIPEF